MLRLTAIAAGLAVLGLAGTATATPAQELRVCARQDVRVAGFIDLGTAELHLARCEDRGQVLADVPKRYVIELARQIDGEALGDSARKLLRRNLGAAAGLDAYDCMNDAYRTAQPGDRYAISWQPGGTLELRLNERLLARCAAPAEAAAYFNIWFGPEPFNEKLRDGLLRQATALR